MSIKPSDPSNECVKVMVRARPMNSKETNNGSQACIEIDKSINQVILNSVDNPERAFTFDAVYDEHSTQRGVYDEGAFPLVESVMQGYNGTIFAYGQTGCGKTHTMLGVKGVKEQNGIIPNAFDHIFGYFDDAENMKKKFLIRCSYLEIYNETIRDLLSSKVDHILSLKESSDKGVFVKDLTTCIVKSIPEIEKYMNQGTNNRKTGETAMNKDSSRSHSIFTIYVETAERDDEGEQRIKAGKLNLVDLAGSERQSKTQATGQRLKEATQINLSLSALGNVISALVEGKHGHIPYRDSKLTRLLQDSLGGNTKTVMIAAISPADYNFEETLTTLRYASRAKNIKNKPRVNQDPKDALLKQYEEEIQKLRAIIEQSKQGTQIQNIDLGQSIKMLNQDQNIKGNSEESVDELLQKLAKKGKKVKLLDESASVKELPRQEDLDDGEEDNGLNDRQQQQEQQQRLGQVDDLDGEIRDDRDDIDEEFNANDQMQSARKEQAQQQQHQQQQQQQQEQQRNKNYLTVEEQEQRQLELEEANAASAQKLIEQQQQQQQIIEETNNQLMDEAKKRNELEAILQEMEERLVMGGNALEEKEKEQAQVQRKLQLELEEERDRQNELLEEQNRREEELLDKEHKYNSLQEEVEGKDKIIKKLKTKLKSTTNELNDIHKENQDKNEELLDTVREQTKELDFLNQMIGFLMTDEQMYKIKEKTEWSESRNKWLIPPFIIKAKEIQLPKLGMNAKDFINEELENQEVNFVGSQSLERPIDHPSPYTQSNMSAQRKTNGFRIESRNRKTRVEAGQNYNDRMGMGHGGNSSNAYIPTSDMGNMPNSSHRAPNEFKMSRNESKSSANFSKDQMRNPPLSRPMGQNKFNNENYQIMNSPDIGHRKLNNKAGVQLAPLEQTPGIGLAGAGRSSMMSMKGIDNNENADGTESHPILRVHNYKKPQLEKLNHPQMQYQQQQQMQNNTMHLNLMGKY